MNPVALLPAGADPASGAAAYLGVRVTLTKTGTRRPLAILQATHDQEDRELAQHVDLSTAREEGLRGKPKEHGFLSMYPAQHYPGYRWGMTIDVDQCVGCQACVVACQAENNVPVVGKAQAAYGRQQHWLRIERWPEGRPERPLNASLPMLCQHCEVARCEPVCPVFAAYRTEEGLNGQVYNRCVGTRYCGNNCPYHVRRFNWYDQEFPAPLDVQLNPDVTVRQLGVMEKCTMCIQRIVAGKDRARDEKRSVRDGDILTACQQTCPTQAITFGNLKDDQSEGSKLAHSPRASHVLGELGTRPSVPYLKKVTGGHAWGWPWEPPSVGGAAAAGEATLPESRPADECGHRAPPPADVRRRQPGRPAHAGHAGQPLLRLDVRGGADSNSGHPGLDVPDLHRDGRGGKAYARDVGDVHHLLRVLDRYRPRGYAHLGDPLPLPGALAHVHLPGGGGHDDLRRHDGRAVPADPRRAHVVRLLPAALLESARSAAALPLAAGVGRLRHLHLPLHQHRLLHRRVDPRRGRPPRRIDGLAPADLRDAGAGLGRIGRAVAALPPRLRAAGRPGHAAGPVGFKRGVVGLRHGPGPRLALHPLPALLRRWRDFLWLRDGAGADPAHASLLQPPRLHPGEAPGRHGQAHSDDRPGADLLLHLRDLHVLVQRRPLRTGVALLEGDQVVRLGALAHVFLQLHLAADPLLEARAHQPGGALRRVRPGADRHVVRALQHHRAIARPRLLPLHVGHLRADADRHHDRHRQLRLVLHPVPRLHPGHAVAVDRGGQGDAPPAAEGRRPWPPLRPSSASSPTWTPRCGPWRICGPRATTTSPCTRPRPCTRSRRLGRGPGR